MMSKLEQYTDTQLIDICNENIGEELTKRGYKYGWYKETEYAGVVYVLVNPAFPNLVKIGYADDVEKRIKTFNRNSGLPDPYHCYCIYKVKKRLEDLKLHILIDSLDSNLRHSNNREFYEMTPEKAYEILSAIAQINGEESLLSLNPLNDDFFSGEEEVGVERKTPRKNLTFEAINVPNGSELVFTEDNSIVVHTFDLNNKVVYNDKVMSISTAAGEIKKSLGTANSSGAYQGGNYFMYDGKRLTDIRKELESSADE